MTLHTQSHTHTCCRENRPQPHHALVALPVSNQPHHLLSNARARPLPVHDRKPKRSSPHQGHHPAYLDRSGHKIWPRSHLTKKPPLQRWLSFNPSHLAYRSDTSVNSVSIPHHLPDRTTVRTDPVDKTGVVPQVATGATGKAERTAKALEKTCKDLGHLHKAMSCCQRHEPCHSSTCRLIACLASLSTTQQDIIDRLEISEDLVPLLLLHGPLQELPEDLLGYRLRHVIQYALLPSVLPHICPTPFLTQRHTGRCLPPLWPPRDHSADPDSSPHPPHKPVSESVQRSSPHIAPLTAPGSVPPVHSRKAVILVRFPVSFRSFPPSLFLTSMVDGTY